MEKATCEVFNAVYVPGEDDYSDDKVWGQLVDKLHEELAGVDHIYPEWEGHDTGINLYRHDWDRNLEYEDAMEKGQVILVEGGRMIVFRLTGHVKLHLPLAEFKEKYEECPSSSSE